jgi:prepilin-type N-terminal cleavage/methylation domain-containing protein
MRFENSNPKSTGVTAAFTLIELMVSMALVVILLLGINQVFKMSSDVVGAGLKTLEINRESRVLNILRDDIRNVPKDAPLFIIHSAPANATAKVPGNFLNAADRASDNDGNPLTVDWNNNGIEGEVPSSGISERLSLAIYGDRNHRADTIAFPTRGVHSRHTADDGAFVSPTKSFDAWVWIGHLKLPDGKDKNGQPIYDPTALGVNSARPAAPNDNLLAANWAIGRVNILLKDESALTIGGTALEQFLWHSPNINNSNPDRLRNLSPLDSDSQSTDRYRIYESRYDLAGTTLERFRQDIQAVQLQVIKVPGFDPNDPTQIPNPAFDRRRDRGWWAHMVYFNDALTEKNLFRFQCNPQIPRKSRSGSLMNSEGMAAASPYFVGNVSQFIVEYAGDFVTQDNVATNSSGALLATYGEVLDIVPDGEVDFYVDWTDPNRPVRKIRWYGLPRDINNDGVILGYVNGRFNNDLVDVVPLRDVRLTALTTARNHMTAMAKINLGNIAQASFEKEVPNINPDYAKLTFTSPQALRDNFKYTCVWTNGAPPMVRVLMKIEDPTGRLKEGQWWEVILDGQ